MAGNIQISPHERRAQTRAALDARVLERCELLSPEGVAELLDVDSEAVSQLEADGKIFCVQTEEGPRYPAFQFDADKRVVRPVISRVLDLAPHDMTGRDLLRFFMMTDADLADGYEAEIALDPRQGYPVSLIGRDDDRLVGLFRARLMNAVEG
ncbi:hypothetical protein [Ruegeria atlantica]|uniref:hypothetical protein n=1 Tax=Ruegeria atlantica TaxID=81569 RepID=UPI002495621D|nr:hypothetical protein [Ruegeria atlantica]